MTIIEVLYKKLSALVGKHVYISGEALYYAENEFQAYVQRNSRNIKTSYATVVAKEECW